MIIITITITTTTIIRHEIGLNRPVSASSISLFKGLLCRLLSFVLQFSITFRMMFFILFICRSQFDYAANMKILVRKRNGKRPKGSSRCGQKRDFGIVTRHLNHKEAARQGRPPASTSTRRTPEGSLITSRCEHALPAFMADVLLQR